MDSQKTEAEIAHLMAQAAKLNRETVLYPLLVGAGLMGAATGLSLTVLKLLSVF